MKPNIAVVNELKAYCNNLFIQWNNEVSNWEVWITMPWGNRLVTPVINSIYDLQADNGFCPLDRRIVKWVYDADSQRKTLKRGWKWIAKNLYKEGFDKRREERYKNYKNYAKENWSLVNREFLGAVGSDSEFVAPDVRGARQRISMRSKENALKAFGDTNDLN